MPDVTAPEAVVKRQLDAYNARDIDGFMATWADDAEYFQHPATLLAAGAAEIRARHELRFQEPHLFGKLIKRVVLGDTVIDHEIVTRDFPEGVGQIEVIAIYAVKAGKIAKAWFLQGVPVFGDENMALQT